MSARRAARRRPSPAALPRVAGATAVASVLAGALGAVMLFDLAGARLGGPLGFTAGALQRQALFELEHGRPGAAARDAAGAAARAPARSQIWVLLSEARAASAGGRFDAAAADALRASYRVSPLDPDLGLWRIRLALSHWGELSPDLREDVLADIAGVCTKGPGNRTRVAALAGAVPDAAGRLALSLSADDCALRARLARP